MNFSTVDGVSRKKRTRSLLMNIQESESPREKQKLAWEVVLLNDAASTWLAKRFCPSPSEDDVSEARLSLYDAALYCHPDKGSSYLSVACWYYMWSVTSAGPDNCVIMVQLWHAPTPIVRWYAHPLLANSAKVKMIRVEELTSRREEAR